MLQGGSGDLRVPGGAVHCVIWAAEDWASWSALT